jgi:hypothetical protein
VRERASKQAPPSLAGGSEALVALQAIADSLSTVVVTETQRKCTGFVTAFYIDAGVRRSLKVDLQTVRV